MYILKMLNKVYPLDLVVLLQYYVPGPISGTGVAVCSVLQEQLCYISVAITGGLVKGSPASIVLDIHWRVLHQQQVPHHVLHEEVR